MPPAFKTPSSVFGKRLREARLSCGLPQDRLGVLSGLDETTASARISRYESGQHEPPFSFAERLAALLNVPAPYLYASDDEMANWILLFARASARQRSHARRILSTGKRSEDEKCVGRRKAQATTNSESAVISSSERVNP